MTEISVETETIYWDDLDDAKQEILDVLERSRDPILWTSEIVERVDPTRPTVLKHLNALYDAEIVGKKENVDAVWWIEEDKDIRPGSRSGVTATLHRWFPTSVQSWVDRWMNRIALFGFGLVHLGMFLIISAAYILANDLEPPTVLGRDPFYWGLIIGMFGFLFMFLKLGSFIGDYAETKIEAHRS